MRRFVAAISALLVTSSLFSQSFSSADQQATSLAAQALSALTHGQPVTDVTLNTNVTWIAGSDQRTGTGTLKALGSSQSRVDLAFVDIIRSEVRSAQGDFPEGSWTRAAISPINPPSQAAALQNCWTDATWFFPALGVLATTDGSATFSYVGAESRRGTSVYHIRSTKSLQALSSQWASASDVASIQHWSTEDLYVDTTSLLPVAVVFNIHPDNNATTDMPAEVRFADYQAINGIQVPMHIQRFLNESLELDITVNSVILNSGLQHTEFAVQ